MARRKTEETLPPDASQETPEDETAQDETLPSGEEPDEEDEEGDDKPKAPKVRKPQAKKGGSRFSVIVRHSPAALKKFECIAEDEEDAFAQYLVANAEKMGLMPNKVTKKDLRHFTKNQDVYRDGVTITQLA
jgi:hypothetical protein